MDIAPLERPVLTPAEIEKARRLLARLEPEAIDALGNVAVGVVTAGRIRRGAMIVFATIGAAATAVIGVANLWHWLRGH